MRMRNPTGYGGIYEELSGGVNTAIPGGQQNINPNMPPENFNPYMYAGLHPEPQQVPGP